ncbi:50S ribosomal protein L22 [Roseiconus lacunae]|uniref:Large ribosomal subunit protein uL22 n=1 Tax=Roseiconus lacunae TaxID=2605694 RepID=A0ABT7PS01_9BACT|nr:50S ribosomal protein L22 [Roseiconus lacunae]MCD0460276.1 50S ribosomal protein L22 [Roseiconus lacunae]MDM4019289.1 50S ribosomal protein L22 [Roseiconus lacunae]WRQ51898.1 50S ribosomal protein L22 [Stieleria sp. HD01]
MSEFKASHRNARISPRKVRLVADLVRGQYADEALDLLKFQPQRGARMLEKVIRSAVANALDPDQTSGNPHRIEELVLTDVRVDGGSMFRRMRPRARGSAHIIKKRSSHITVSVTPIDEIAEV